MLLPVLVSIAVVVSMISSLGAPLVPLIATTRHVSDGTAQWSLTVTLLVGAACGQVVGRLGDGGRRRMTVLCMLGAVVAGCLLAAAIPSIAAILIGRALQGLGLGLVPVAIATARDHIPAGQVRSAVATLSVATAAGLGVGYPMTGLAALVGGITAAFALGAALTAAVLLLAFLALPDAPTARHRRLDTRGAVLLAAALTAWLVALSEGAAWGWRSGPVLALAAAGLAALGLWIRHSLRVEQPLVAVRLLADRRVLLADATAVLVGAAMYLLMSLVSRTVQAPASTGYGLGHSTLTAGLAMLPLTVGSIAANKLAPALGRRLGPTAVLSAGAAITAAALLLWGVNRGQLWAAFAALGLGGAGMGFTFAAMPGLLLSAVPSGETGSANGFNQALRQLGGAIGSALSTALVPAGPSAVRDAGSGIDRALSVGIALCLFNALAVTALSARDRLARKDRAES
jgi:predicted MFS family arabinose efflux permease